VRHALGRDELAGAVFGRDDRLNVRLDPGLGLDELPALGQLDKLASIQLAVAVYDRKSPASDLARKYTKQDRENAHL
jgi:hypothetical protein